MKANVFRSVEGQTSAALLQGARQAKPPYKIRSASIKQECPAL